MRTSNILPRVAFKSDETIMLDGTTHAELQAQLGLPVRALDFDGFARMIEGDVVEGDDEGNTYYRGIIKPLEVRPMYRLTPG